MSYSITLHADRLIIIIDSEHKFEIPRTQVDGFIASLTDVNQRVKDYEAATAASKMQLGENE